MIIDVHVHNSSRITDNKRTLREIRKECRMNGVSLCLLSSVDGGHFPTKTDVRLDNETARSLSENSQGLILWYAYINPQNCNWREEMDRRRASGAIGIKLLVSLKDRRGGLENTEKVLEHAARLRLPALIHVYDRTDEKPLKRHGRIYPFHPVGDVFLTGEITMAEFMELARRHPETRMIAAHAGVHWPATTGLLQHLPNVWADISGGYPIKGQVESLVREIGADRVLFGSDCMGRSAASQLAKVILADISEAQKRMILRENAISLFGLKNMEAQKDVRPVLSAFQPDETEDHFCFCGQWPFFKSACSTAAELNSLLTETGIKRAYVADLGGIYRQDLETANAAFLRTVRKFKRIRPLAIINPRTPNWRSVLEKTSEFAGIILFPHLHAWNIADPRYKGLFELCRKRGVKVWINCHLDDLRFRHAGAAFREVSAEELLAFGAWPEAPESVFQGVAEDMADAFLKRHSRDRRFRFEISRLTDASGSLRNVLRKYGAERLVMGSEYPFRDIRQVRWTCRRV